MSDVEPVRSAAAGHCTPRWPLMHDAKGAVPTLSLPIDIESFCMRLPLDGRRGSSAVSGLARVACHPSAGRGCVGWHPSDAGFMGKD